MRDPFTFECTFVAFALSKLLASGPVKGDKLKVKVVLKVKGFLLTKPFLRILSQPIEWPVRPTCSLPSVGMYFARNDVSFVYISWRTFQLFTKRSSSRCVPVKANVAINFSTRTSVASVTEAPLKLLYGHWSVCVCHRSTKSFGSFYSANLSVLLQFI